MFSPDTPFIKRRKLDNYKSPLGKRGLQYSVEARNVRARTFEEDISVTMPVYGRSGSDWTGSRRSVVTVSKDTLAKRVAKEEQFYITRMIKMNEFDKGVGYNKLEYNNTSGRLPVWLCDLTDFDNVTRVAYKSTIDATNRNALLAHAAIPWYVLNFKQTGVGHDFYGSLPTGMSVDNELHEERSALFFDRLYDYKYEMELSTIASTNQGKLFDPTQTVPGNNPTTIAPGEDNVADSFSPYLTEYLGSKTPMLKWIDFRGMFYGVKSREVEWTVSVVQFAKDYLDPVPNDKFDVAVNGDNKVRERFQFWYKTAKKLTAHPLLPKTMGDYTPEKGLRYLAKYKFKVRESLSDADQINKVEKRINMRLNKILRKKWQYDATNNNVYDAASVYGDGKGLDDPMSKNASSIRECTRIHPRSRVYLMITATCPKSAEENADVATITQPVIDPTKVRTVEFEVPFMYVNGNPGRSSNYIGGRNDQHDPLDTINPSTTILPIDGSTNALLGSLKQVDAPDVDDATGQNGIRTTTTGSTDVRGQLHVGTTTLSNATGNMYGAPKDVLMTYTVADPGRDNPTFDFTLRMKYVI